MAKRPLFSPRRFLTAATLAFSIPLAATAVAQQRPPAAPPNAPGGAGCAQEDGPMPPYLRLVTLTDSQRDKIFELLHAQAPTMREKAKGLHKAEDDLRALVVAGDYSDAKAKALADAGAKLTAEMTLARIKTDRQVLELLTAEQRAKIANFKPGADGPRGPAGDHRPPPDNF